MTDIQVTLLGGREANLIFRGDDAEALKREVLAATGFEDLADSFNLAQAAALGQAQLAENLGHEKAVGELRRAFQAQAVTDEQAPPPDPDSVRPGITKQAKKDAEATRLADLEDAIKAATSSDTLNTLWRENKDIWGKVNDLAQEQNKKIVQAAKKAAKKEDK